MNETIATDCNDEESLRVLMKRMAEGDVNAFTRFYQATSQLVTYVAGQICGTHVDDIVSEAYAQLWSDARAYDPLRSSPTAWILVLARSRALDRARREVVRHAGAMYSPEFDDDSVPQALEFGPESILQRKQACASLHAALSHLSSTERWLLTLAYFRDHTHLEIATLTQIPLGTVKTLIRRSMMRLRAMLETSDEAEPAPRAEMPKTQRALSSAAAVPA